jgi:hypothetical protein
MVQVGGFVQRLQSTYGFRLVRVCTGLDQLIDCFFVTFVGCPPPEFPIIVRDPRP